MEPATATLIATGAMMAMQGVGSYIAGEEADKASAENVKLQKFLLNKKLDFQKDENELNRDQSQEQFDAQAPQRGANVLATLQPSINKADKLKKMSSMYSGGR